MVGNIQRHTPEPEGHPAPVSRNPLMSLREEVDRLFDNFFTNPFGRSAVDLDPLRRSAALRGMGDIMPEVDVRETADRLEISAELPGLDEQDVSVTVRDGVLTIAGEKKAERKEEGADYHLSERAYGSFTRAFRLPESADEDGIAADFAKGVLTISVPKKPEARPQEKKIEVRKH